MSKRIVTNSVIGNHEIHSGYAIPAPRNARMDGWRAIAAQMDVGDMVEVVNHSAATSLKRALMENGHKAAVRRSGGLVTSHNVWRTH